MHRFLQQLKILIAPLWKVLEMVWQSSSRWTIAHGVLLLVQAVLPLGLLLLLKRIVDTLDLSLGAPSSFSSWQIGLLIGAYAGIWLMTNVIQSVIHYITESQQHLTMDYMATLLQRKSIELDLAYYENPRYQDTFHKAQYEATYRPIEVLKNSFSLLQNGLSLLTIAGLLFFLHWSVALIMALAAIPTVLFRIRFVRKIYKWEKERINLDRRSWYLNFLLTTDRFAKEVRLFGFGAPLIERYGQLRDQLFREKTRILRQRTWFDSLGRSIEVLAMAAVFGYIAWKTASGNFSIGDVVMYIQAFQRGQTYLAQAFQNLARLYNNRLFLNFLFDFLQLQPKIQSPEKIKDTFCIRKGIELNKVSFTYPDNNEVTLKDITLSLPLGQVIAIVGKNGSGKTTLIKLLSRLYDPESGSITVDGKDIRDLSLENYRRQISVLFQDYVKYQMSVTENIGLGRADLLPDLERVQKAARFSGAEQFINKFPETYEQMLGRQYFEGAELSGGQWQKIALARGFYRDADVIILDEPTSAVDPLAEFGIFSQLRNIKENKLILLITHRLYNLQMADQIIVMDEGRVVQQGPFRELMYQPGLFRDLFEKQQLQPSLSDGQH